MSLSRLLVSALASLAIAAPAAAGAPNGNGLGVITLPCAGGEVTFVAPRPGQAATVWNLTTDQHVVAKSFDAVITFTPTGGGPPVVIRTESKTYGVKEGLDAEQVCTFSQAFPVEDGSIAVDATLVAVAVPPR